MKNSPEIDNLTRQPFNLADKQVFLFAFDVDPR
jgi:hypothetical protein